MPSLLDHIDRFSYTVQSLQSTSKQVARNPKGPFARAALETPLWHLARDIDASEVGLFTLTSNSTASGNPEEVDAAGVQKPELTRVEFLGATPLKKVPGVRRKEEKEPEVYAEAALKYLDKYHSIRPMPRARQEVAELLDHLATLREEIETLSETATQDVQVDSEPSLTVKGEEKRIQELTSRLKQLKSRKDILLKRRTATGGPSLPTPSYAADKSEDAFWNEPVSQATSKPRQSLLLASGDDSFLLESEMGVNIADISLDSLSDVPSTPLPVRLPAKQRKIGDEIHTAPILKQVATVIAKEDDEKNVAEDHQPSPRGPSPGEVEGDAEDSDDEGEGEKTVVLKKLPPLSESPSQTKTGGSPSPPQATPARQVTPPPPPRTKPIATPGTEGKSRLRVSADTERIVAKIWTTVGDVIMPGHPFNVASTATSNKPPRAKETITLLQTISSQFPLPSSPSTLSTLSLTDTTASSASQPTAFQILTALLLLTLLSNPPTYSMPLIKAKEALAAKGIGAAVAEGPLSVLSMGSQALETRALYGCIAKRLLKIDRGGKEQILMFAM